MERIGRSPDYSGRKASTRDQEPRSNSADARNWEELAKWLSRRLATSELLSRIEYDGRFWWEANGFEPSTFWRVPLAQYHTIESLGKMTTALGLAQSCEVGVN